MIFAFMIAVFIVLFIASSVEDIRWLAVTSMIGLILSIICIFIFYPETKEEVTDTYDIYALQDNFQTSGGGSFTYHYVDEELNYHVRREYKGGFKTIELDGDDVYLIETEDNPRVEIVSNVAVDNEWMFGRELKIVDIRIYVPKGSIINEFSSDMK